MSVAVEEPARAIPYTQDTEDAPPSVADVEQTLTHAVEEIRKQAFATDAPVSLAENGTADAAAEDDGVSEHSTAATQDASSESDLIDETSASKEVEATEVRDSSL